MSAPNEGRQTPESAFADAQALSVVESRHEGIQRLPSGALGAVAAREVARVDVEGLNSFIDKSLKGRAAAMMGSTAEQHPSYRTALLAASPQYAGLAEQAHAESQQKPAPPDVRKTVDGGDLRDEAANNIATRYANMARAGLSVNDLQGPAIDRLAVMDSRDLQLIEGQPPHHRADESRSLVAQSMKSDAYTAAFNRETATRTIPSVDQQPGLAARTATVEPQDLAVPAAAAPMDQKQGTKAAVAPGKAGAELNSMRSEGATAGKRQPIPPLEDRFNVMRIGLIEREYHFRDQAGKVAFTDKLLSISTGTESAAAIKAMVDRATERGWKTVRLQGSQEFVRQGWIAADAQGLKAVGHTPSTGDREAALKEQARLQTVQDVAAPQRRDDGIERVQSVHVDRVDSDQRAAELSGQRQLAAAIEKALVEGKVSPEIRGQVRAMMAAEGTRRLARGERLKVPVYDARAPRGRAKTTQAGPQRHGDRERSR